MEVCKHLTATVSTCLEVYAHCSHQMRTCVFSDGAKMSVKDTDSFIFPSLLWLEIYFKKYLLQHFFRAFNEISCFPLIKIQSQNHSAGIAILGRTLIPFPFSIARSSIRVPLSARHSSDMSQKTFKDRDSTSSSKYLSHCLRIAVLTKAKINLLCCNVNILLLVVFTMDREQFLHFGVHFMYLKTGFAGCFGVFCCCCFVYLFSLHRGGAPLLQSFFVEYNFCNSDHICYFSLGTFQLMHTILEAWYSNLDNIFQPRSHWRWLKSKDYS